MRFFGTSQSCGMHYRDASRIPSRDAGEDMYDPRTTQTPRVGDCTQMNEDALLLYIQRLDFVRVELELYLDGYPECQSALRYYREIVEKLKAATSEYENKYGPLTARNTRGDAWLWVKGKWPWQTEEWR